VLRKTIGVESSFPFAKKSKEVLLNKGLLDIKGEWFIGIQTILFANLTYFSWSSQFDNDEEYISF
jgi:hypothetical protein